MERLAVDPQIDLSVYVKCYAYWKHMNRLRHAFPEKYAQSFFEVRLIAGRIAAYARGRDLTGTEKRVIHGFRRSTRGSFSFRIWPTLCLPPYRSSTFAMR